jgi:hypothetical protein
MESRDTENLMLTKNLFRYLVTDNGSNIIKAVRLLQDADHESNPAGPDSDSDSSEDESEQLRNPMDLDTVQREEEEFEIRDATLQEEVENMGKKRGKCFRYHILVLGCLKGSN